MSRDGCRVPIPWGTGDEAWVNPWLPLPARWDALTAQSQEPDPNSTLNFYRQALRQRRDFHGDLHWQNAPDGVLWFRRGDRQVVVNLSEHPILLGGHPRLTSAPLAPDGSLPPDTAAWL